MSRKIIFIEGKCKFANKTIVLNRPNAQPAPQKRIIPNVSESERLRFL